MSDWLDANSVELAANIITIVGLPVAVTGLFFVGGQMKSDHLATSASALSDMRTRMLDRIERLHQANVRQDAAGWEDEFKEFANDLEMACAVYLDGQMTGRTGTLGRKLLCDLLEIVNSDEDMRAELQKGIHAPDTFTNIRDFRARVTRDD